MVSGARDNPLPETTPSPSYLGRAHFSLISLKIQLTVYIRIPRGRGETRLGRQGNPDRLENFLRLLSYKLGLST